MAAKAKTKTKTQTKAKTKTKTKTTTPVVTACAPSARGPDQQVPLDRPEWLVGSTSAAAIKGVLKVLCAPHPVPKSDSIDLTVDGTEVRLIVLPPYDPKTPIDAWLAARRPIATARNARIYGGLFALPVPANLKLPPQDVYKVGGWLRSISKVLPLYIDPRGYLLVYTTQTAFPEKAWRGRTMWTVYNGIRMVFDTQKGKHEVWNQILQVARA